MRHGNLRLGFSSANKASGPDAGTGGGRWNNRLGSSRSHVSRFETWISRVRCSILDRCTGESGRMRQLLFGYGNTLFQNIERHSGFVLVDDERRGKADGVFSAAEDEEAALEGEIDNAVAQERGGFPGLLILHDFDADHEAASTDVANDGMFCRPVVQAREHLLALSFSVGEALALEDVDGRERGGDADGVAAEGGGVGARFPVHDGGAGHADAERHAGGDAFGHADDVGLDAGVLDGPPLTGAACAGLYFVGDQQDAVLVGHATQFLHKDGWGDDVAALALDGCYKDGGDFFRRQGGVEELLFDVARAAECEGFLFLWSAGTAAIGVRIADVGDSGNEWGETAGLLRLWGGERKCAHGTAVEGSKERDDVLAAGVITGDLERAFDGLGAGVAVVEAMRPGHGRDG